MIFLLPKRSLALGRIYYTKLGVPLVTTTRIVASGPSEFARGSRESSPTSCGQHVGMGDFFKCPSPNAIIAVQFLF